MTPEEGPTNSPAPLDYEPPTISQAAQQRRFTVAAIATVAAVLLAVPCTFGACAAANSSWPAWAMGVAAVALALWPIHLRRNPATRPYAGGIWTGLAVAALLEGFCFAIVMR